MNKMQYVVSLAMGIVWYSGSQVNAHPIGAISTAIVVSILTGFVIGGKEQE